MIDSLTGSSNTVSDTENNNNNNLESPHNASTPNNTTANNINTNSTTNTSNNTTTNKSTIDLYYQLLMYIMKSFTAITSFDTGHNEIMQLCPSFADLLYKILSYQKQCPIAIENCLEVISRCAVSSVLQQAFINAGLIWKLIPMILAYDGTLEEDFSEEGQRCIYNQNACNMHAVVAAKVLGRLGGKIVCHKQDILYTSYI